MRLVERRAARRYPIELEVHYRLKRGERILDEGTGTTLDLSSAGVAFRCERVFRRAASITLSISWPVLLAGTCPLSLQISGKITRSDGEATAVEILQYAFRTRGIRQAAPRSLMAKAG